MSVSRSAQRSPETEIAPGRPFRPSRRGSPGFCWRPLLRSFSLWPPIPWPDFLRQLHRRRVRLPHTLHRLDQLLQPAPRCAVLESVYETFKFTIITVVFEFVLGMGIALVVNSVQGPRGAAAAMLVPWAVITVVNAQMWKLMYNDTYGVFNDILERIHFPGAPFSFLHRPQSGARLRLTIDIWKTTPFVALLLLAGLQVIPGDVYEAAEVDGASTWNQFWRITLPLLRPAILVTLIFRTMDALRVFDVFYVLFGARAMLTGQLQHVDGGLRSAELRNLRLTSIASTQGGIGYGAAISVAIFIILADRDRDLHQSDSTGAFIMTVLAQKAAVLSRLKLLLPSLEVRSQAGSSSGWS